MSELSTKRCTKCERDLPLSSFHKHRSKKYGLCSQCKECVKAYDARWHETNRERDNTRRKAWHITNREHDNAKMRAWHITNREHEKASKKAYHRTLRGFVNQLWHGINRRTINGEHPNWKNKSCCRYLNKKIELRITREELYQFVLLHWDFIQAIWDSGESADLHRPDGNGHYELGNMQFLARSEHLKLHGRNNKKRSA